MCTIFIYLSLKTSTNFGVNSIFFSFKLKKMFIFLFEIHYALNSNNTALNPGRDLLLVLKSLFTETDYI